MEGKYKKIDTIDTTVWPWLDKAIDTFLNHINNEDGHLEDCYRDEIESWLKAYWDHIPRGQFYELKEYYVLGGIYEKYGQLR